MPTSFKWRLLTGLSLAVALSVCLAGCVDPNHAVEVAPGADAVHDPAVDTTASDEPQIAGGDGADAATAAAERAESSAGEAPFTLLDNFHVIAEGRAFRSAQPRDETLAYAARELGVKTVINLRGENPDEAWYQREREHCAALGVELVDVRFGSSELPAAEELVKLYDAIAESDGPVLMHCHSGADRSGLAAALWRMIVLGEDAESAANRELTLRYGHLRARRPAMTDMVEMFVPERSWIVNEYPKVREAYVAQRSGPG